MLAAMKYIQEVKNKVPDAGTDLRNSIFFAQRTINAFKERSEHEMRTMIVSLL